MCPIARLEVEYIPAPEIEVELLRRLWRLRLDYFPLGPARTEEKDWEEFSAYFRRARREVVVFRRGGEVMGFYVNSHDVVEHAGRRALLVAIEYTYMRPEARGDAAFIASGLRMYARLKGRHPLTPIYYVCFCFPNSFAFLTASFGLGYTLQENPPAFEAHLLAWYGREAGGAKWDEHRGVARYENLPPEIPDRDTKPAHLRALYDRYERINPTWRSGDALVLLAPADRRAFCSVLGRIAHRALRLLRAGGVRQVRTC